MKLVGKKRNAQEYLSSYKIQEEVFFMPKNEFSNQFFKWSSQYGINESEQKEFVKQLLEYSSDRYTQSNDDFYQKAKEVQEELVLKKENISAKKLNLSGGVFYKELKSYISDPDSMMKYYDEEFREFLDNAEDVKSPTDLYSLVLQEAIKEKNKIIIKQVLNNCKDLELLLNLNQANENAILYTIKIQDKEILDLLYGYIQETNINHNIFTLDELLSGYISNEFSFNVPHEEQDDYYQKLIVPLYGEVGGE